MTTGTTSASASRRAARLRAAHRKCLTCGTPQSLRVVHHPSGYVVLCVHCGDVHSAARLLRPA